MEAPCCGDNPGFKLEVFGQTSAPSKQVMGMYSPYIVSNVMPGMNPNLQHLFAPSTAFSYGPNIQLPMQKVYNINLPGPTGGHVEMNKIYENVLPGKDVQFAFITLGERLTMYDYVRQILVKTSDGEDICLDSTDSNSLMSYIKFMELNPGYYSPLFRNPYRGLPYGLLIYRSCFPIQVEQRTHAVICAKDSLGLNIRLYSLTLAEYYSYKFRQTVYLEYDVWREIIFYEYLRENILKKKICPHFPLLYAFFLSPNNKINFFNLKKSFLTQKDYLTKEYKRFLEMNRVKNNPLLKKILGGTLTAADLAMLQNAVRKLPDEIDPLLQTYCGVTLIAVTEAPMHNLYQWASRSYETEGVVRKMITHGFYNDIVWWNVIFQIVVGLYVLQKYGIYIKDMTIQDNIYIKDCPTGSKAMGYWKYVINGIPYYLPNYGYIVLIDSNFKDIINQNMTLPYTNRQYKIEIDGIFNNQCPGKDLENKIFQNYRNIISTNAFGKEHTKGGFMKPPDEVLKKIDQMMLDPEKKLDLVIQKYFRFFLHNRIGTYLYKDTEVPNIRDSTGIFKTGEMAIQVVDNDTYKWCLIMEIKNDMVTILTKKTPEDTKFEEQEISITGLKQYSPTEKIEQKFIGTDTNFSDENLLETYIIS
jgi:hypothetical protein